MSTLAGMAYVGENGEYPMPPDPIRSFASALAREIGSPEKADAIEATVRAWVEEPPVLSGRPRLTSFYFSHGLSGMA